jgi:hypothetical protein
MQPVLNSKERNIAFLQFLVFFLITVALIVGAIYYNFQTDNENNKILRARLDKYESGIEKQKRFVALMGETKVLLDSLSKPRTNTLLLDLMLEPKLKELSNLRQMDTSLYGKLDYAILESFFQLRQGEKDMARLQEQKEMAEQQTLQLKEYLNNRMPISDTTINNTTTQ